MQIRSLVAIALLLLASACERAPDLAQPSSYAKDDLAFSFPGNWSVTADQAESGAGGSSRNVVIESPGNAIVLVQLYMPPVETTAEEFSAELMKTTIQEVEHLIEVRGVKPVTAQGSEPSAVQSVVAGVLRDGVERNFVIRVLGEPVPHRARTFRIEDADSVVFLFAQASTEDWSKVAPGFDLIASTLALE